MVKNNIIINTETRQIKRQDFNFLGVAGENEVEQLVFSLTDFIDGVAIIELKKNIEKFFIALEKQNENYVLDIKSSLLSDVDKITMQLHITTENAEIFKSKIFEMKIYEQIHATETIPEQYAEWIDIANAKIAEINNLKSTVEQAEENRNNAEIARNRAVNEAISNIHNLTEEYNTNASARTNEFNANAEEKTNLFNRNAETKTTAFDNNASNKTNDFNDNATEKKEDFDEDASIKKQELEDIAEVVRDLASSMQYASFRLVPQTGQVQIKQPSKMSNTRFRINNGNLEVKII